MHFRRNKSAWSTIATFCREDSQKLDLPTNSGLKHRESLARPRPPLLHEQSSQDRVEEQSQKANHRKREATQQDHQSAIVLDRDLAIGVGRIHTCQQGQDEQDEDQPRTGRNCQRYSRFRNRQLNGDDGRKTHQISETESHQFIFRIEGPQGGLKRAPPSLR